MLKVVNYSVVELLAFGLDLIAFGRSFASSMSRNLKFCHAIFSTRNGFAVISLESCVQKRMRRSCSLIIMTFQVCARFVNQISHMTRCNNCKSFYAFLHFPQLYHHLSCISLIGNLQRRHYFVQQCIMGAVIHFLGRSK